MQFSDDLDLDEAALGIVVTLIDQLHGARFALQSMELALADETKAVRVRFGAALSASSDWHLKARVLAKAEKVALQRGVGEIDDLW